jgi:hypothetical protein
MSDPKTDAEGYFKPKPVPESPQDEQTRVREKMARQKAERLAREKADKGSQ